MGRNVFFEMLHIFIILFKRFTEFLKLKKKNAPKLSVFTACVLRWYEERERLIHNHNDWECSEHRRGGKALTAAIFFKKLFGF